MMRTSFTKKVFVIFTTICVLLGVGWFVIFLYNGLEDRRLENTKRFAVELEATNEEGRKASLVGLPVESCPYSMISSQVQQRTAWVRGWQKGFLEMKGK